MLQTIRNFLLQIVEDIDAGNSYMSQEDTIEIANFLKEFNSRDKYISKYQAFTYLNMSRAKFDGLVRAGILPKGKKIAGFKELQWSLKEIKEYGRKVATSKSLNV